MEKIAYAVVSKRNPKIRVNDIYEHKDVRLNEGEKFVKVRISIIK